MMAGDSWKEIKSIMYGGLKQQRYCCTLLKQEFLIKNYCAINNIPEALLYLGRLICGSSII